MLTVIFAPYNYGATLASHTAGRLLYQELKRRGEKVYYIPTPYCRKEIAEEILDLVPEEVLIGYYGHGTRDRLCGNINYHCSTFFRPYGMIDLKDVDYLKGHVYAVACWTARQLGKIAAEREYVLSYLGFDIPCYIAYNKPEHAYLDDWAYVYGLVYPLMLIETNDPELAFKFFKKEIENLIKNYKLKSNIWEYAEHYASRHISNLKHILLYY